MQHHRHDQHHDGGAHHGDARDCGGDELVVWFASARRQHLLLLQGAEAGIGHGGDVEGGVDVQQQHRVVHGDDQGEAVGVTDEQGARVKVSLGSES
jgi:hypothetical protein